MNIDQSTQPLLLRNISPTQNYSAIDEHGRGAMNAGTTLLQQTSNITNTSDRNETNITITPVINTESNYENDVRILENDITRLRKEIKREEDRIFQNSSNIRICGKALTRAGELKVILTGNIVTLIFFIGYSACDFYFHHWKGTNAT